MSTTVFQLSESVIPLLKVMDIKYVQSGLTYGWKAETKIAYDQGHWNKQILKNSRLFPFDHSRLPYIKYHPELNTLWNIIQATTGKTNLLRCYINGYTYGTDGYAHIDEEWIDQVYGSGASGDTLIVYLNETWNIDWAGETVVFDNNKEIETAILPKYGRVLSFQSSKLHAKSLGKTYSDVFADFMPEAVNLMCQDVIVAREQGRDIVWDQTSTTVKSRVRKFNMLPDYDHIAVVFKTPEHKELMRRLFSRPGKEIPDHVIASMIASWEEPSLEEGFKEIWIAG